MAVKVMFAPAIAQRDAPSNGKGPTAKEPKQRSEAKPKRRRSSVYDADGNEVFITLMCLKCHKMRPLSQFGLRRMADGAIRNQPWCRSCRSGSSAGANAEDPKKQEDPSTPEESPINSPSGDKVVDPGSIAAQVVAALHGGRG